MYQLRNKILPVLLTSMVEAENFSDHTLIGQPESVGRQERGYMYDVVGRKYTLMINNVLFSDPPP